MGHLHINNVSEEMGFTIGLYYHLQSRRLKKKMKIMIIMNIQINPPSNPKSLTSAIIIASCDGI
jgi:hypothetical protein